MKSVLSTTLLLLSCYVNSLHGFTFQQPLSSSLKTQRTQLQMVAEDAKVVLVTGSSRGLGKAVALEMGKSQQKVIINYVSDSSKESAESVVQEIIELGGDAIAVQCDSK